MQIESIFRTKLENTYVIDRKICSPRFECSNHWSTGCVVASCFKALLRERGVIQATFKLKVQRLVKGVARHLCDLGY
jgi:hypothetical protein